MNMRRFGALPGPRLQGSRYFLQIQYRLLAADSSSFFTSMLHTHFTKGHPVEIALIALSDSHKSAK